MMKEENMGLAPMPLAAADILSADPTMDAASSSEPEPGSTHATALPAPEEDIENLVVYQLDADGYLMGPALADRSPLDEGIVWLIPSGCVEPPPPSDLPAGHRFRFVDGVWTMEPDIIDTSRDAATDDSPGSKALTPRQLYRGLAERGLITWQAAEAAACLREIPSELTVYIDTITDETNRARERFRVRTAAQFFVHDPYVLAIAQTEGWDEPVLQEFWAFCSGL